MSFLRSKFAALFCAVFTVWVGIVAYAYFRAVPVDDYLANLCNFFALRGFQQMPHGALLPLAGYYLKQLALTGLLFVSAFGWGRAACALFRFTGDSKSEETFFSVGFGFVLLMYYVLVIGWAGLLYAATYLLFVIPGALNGVRVIVAERKSFPALPSFTSGALTVFLKLVMACCLFFVFVTALAPEIFVDGLYYLTLPLSWLRAHRIFLDPHTILSYLPSNGVYVYLFGVMLGDGVTTKLIHAGFGLLTVFALYQWTKQRYSATAAVIAGFLYLSIPFVMIVMCRTGMDMIVAFFETLALFSIVAYVHGPREARMRWLVAGAVFCGAAMGTRYVSAVCFLSILAVLALLALRKRAPVKDLFIFCLVALSLFAPYVARNYRATGMLLYPFSASASQSITYMANGKAVTITEPRQMPKTVGSLLTAPWYIALRNMNVTDEPFSGALLLVLLPLSFLLLKAREKNSRLLAAYAVAYYICWFMVRTYFRYLLPGLPALCIVLGYVISTLSGDLKKIVTAALAIFGVANVLYAVEFIYTNVDPWPVVTGYQPAGEYLATQRPFYYHCPGYPAIAWANAQLPDNAKILFFGDARAFYCKKDFVMSGISDPSPLVSLLRESKTGDDLYAKLRGRGVTHILWNVPEMIQQSRYDALDVHIRDLAVFDDFWKKHAREIYRGIPDLSIPVRGLYSCNKQRPPFWEQNVRNPLQYVYLYEIVPGEAGVRAGAAPQDFLLSMAVYPPQRREQLIAEMKAQRR